jgi:predicted PurR-regulated permease PerM
VLYKLTSSYKTIIFSVVFLLFLWFVYQIKDILLMLFVAIILTSALNPAVDRLEKLRIPRSIAIFIIYALLWGVFGTLVAAVIPSVIDQTTRLIQTLPAAISRVDFLSSHQQDISQQLISYLSTLPSDILKLIVNVFGNVITVLTTVVISYYLILEHKKLDTNIARFIDPQKTEHISKTIVAIEQRLGGWVRGELILMLSVGLFTYLGLTILGLDIALPLAILAGLFEIIPNIGPIISAVPAVLVALTVHPLLALSTVALYFLTQVLENNLLVPKVMQKAAGVHPLISILSLLIGFRIQGPVGTILALPVVIICQVIFDHFRPVSQPSQGV